jgi:uncharacterized protein (TIGR02271 family)
MINKYSCILYRNLVECFICFAPDNPAGSQLKADKAERNRIFQDLHGEYWHVLKMFYLLSTRGITPLPGQPDETKKEMEECKMTKKVVGVYDNQNELIEAIEEYKNNGYAVQDFSIIGDTTELSSALESRTGVTTENISTTDQDRKEGGFWQSLMTAFDTDRNLGGNEPSISDRLVGLGLTDDAASEYEEDVRNGRIILLAETTASGLNVEDTGYVTDTSVTGMGVNGNYNTTDTYDTEERTLRLREEQLDVTKETVQTGEVEVHKDVVEEQQRVNIPVSREEVYVERRDVNEAATGAEGVIEDGETIRVPIMEEKVEVTKRPVVTEELVIGKREVTETEQVVETVKREEAHLQTDNETVVSDLDGNRDLDGDGFKDK